MTTTAYLAVAPDGRTHRDQVYLREAALPGLRRLTDAVKAEGAPSRIPSPLSMQMIRGATEQDLDRVLRDYVTVVEWSTGTVGRHAIAGILARPELELVGVWVSSDEKDGKDVGELCGTEPLDLAATQDKAALIALKPDCVVHTAMTDADPFAALGLFEELLAAGINVVSSGPVFLRRGWCSSTSHGPTPRSGRTGPSRRPAPGATGSRSRASRR
jgi:hypothetical protein